MVRFVMQVMYIVSQFVFGYGVGGEYPMAAGSAAERAEAGGKAMAKKRGREVVLTFSMQVGGCPCSHAMYFSMRTVAPAFHAWPVQKC